MQQIPVYAFTGFLESGKTKFIQETLEDARFNQGEKTLLLVFEEGEEEFDVSTYPSKNVYIVVEDQTAITTEKLDSLLRRTGAERVVVELNGMQPVSDFYQKMPEGWVVAQEVMFADARTILSYNANMRQLVYDKLSGADLVVFNRMDKNADVMPFHQLARSAKRGVDIIYDYPDGTTQFDDIADPLPFDINAPVIEINDEDYALWYRDISEEPKKYHGKTVKFKAQVAKLRKQKEGYFAPGRFVMTCCEADISFMGLPCKYGQSNTLASRSWVMVTAEISVRFSPLYKGVGPVLTAVEVIPAEAPEREVATFR